MLDAAADTGFQGPALAHVHVSVLPALVPASLSEETSLRSPLAPRSPAAVRNTGFCWEPEAVLGRTVCSRSLEEGHPGPPAATSACSALQH